MYSSFDFGKPTVFNTTGSNLIKKNPISINTNINVNIEIVPRKIIMRNSQKYLYRKTAINKKFDWLNKYLSAISPKVQSPFKIQTRKLRKNSKVNHIHLVKTQPDQYTQFQEGLIYGNTKNIKQKNCQQADSQYQGHLKVFILNQQNKQNLNRMSQFGKQRNNQTINTLKFRKNQTSNYFRMRKQGNNNNKSTNSKKIYNGNLLNNNIKSHVNIQSLDKYNKKSKKNFNFRDINQNQLNKYNHNYSLGQDFDLKPWNNPKDENQNQKDEDEFKQNIHRTSINPYGNNIKDQFQQWSKIQKLH